MCFGCWWHNVIYNVGNVEHVTVVGWYVIICWQKEVPVWLFPLFCWGSPYYCAPLRSFHLLSTLEQRLLARLSNLEVALFAGRFPPLNLLDGMQWHWLAWGGCCQLPALGTEVCRTVARWITWFSCPLALLWIFAVCIASLLRGLVSCMQRVSLGVWLACYVWITWVLSECLSLYVSLFCVPAN